LELLTKRQKQVLDFVRQFVSTHGYAPSLAEIASQLGLASPATVYEHMRGLEKKGYLQRGWNKKRSVKFSDSRPQEGSESIELPLLGVIAAGNPIEAVLDTETVSVPSAMVSGGRCFALRVRGSSMINDHICDGDIVVVRTANSAQNGETVVALVEGSHATLKRFYRDGSNIRLQPANESMPPILLTGDQVAVQGVVLGLFRTF
jgi:repressor LexA